MLEVRHLLTTGGAPSGPELQIHRLLSIESAQIDRVAVKRLDDHMWRRRPHQPFARRFRPLLARGFARERPTQYPNADERGEPHPSHALHGASVATRALQNVHKHLRIMTMRERAAAR